MASKQLTFSMKDLPCEKVVVFKDRAEVKRSVKTNLKKGENEIVINGVTNSIDRDSVRVEGHGQATVLDVVCQSKHVEIEKASGDNDRIKELRAELDRLESQQESNRYKLDKLNRQIAVLNEFANTLSKPTPAGNNQNSSGPLINSKESVDNFLNFIDSYSEKFDALSEKKHTLEKEIKKLDEQIRVTRENLDRLQYSNYTENIEIVILLESAKDDNEVNLHVSYLVYSASWTPKYDIRVFNKEKEKSMTINYYGMIVQSTGEDWNDTKISLSTAVPSVGGNVPELETVNVKIREPVHYEPRAKGGFGGGIMMARMKNESVMMADYAAPMAMACVAAPAPPIQQQVAQVQTSTIGSTSTYDIPRSATIPSDNNTHKVSIGIIELKPEFEYESVPKKSLHAYIKAKVINTSEYALLAGPASVFLDNNFVAKTELKAYSPLEEFQCSLGVDPAIKVDYKPIKKYKAQSGLISKTTTTTYHQIIELKNTSQTSAKVLLVDNLPLSNDDKIQVKLLEPVIKKDSTSIRINKQNNLEFDLNIPSGKTEEISIKYTIDHPSDKEIDLF